MPKSSEERKRESDLLEGITTEVDLLEGVLAEEDLLSGIISADLAPVQEAIDTIPEEEWPAPYEKTPGFIQGLLEQIGGIGMNMGPAGPQVTPDMPSHIFAERFDVTPTQAVAMHAEAQLKGLRYLDSAEFFARGALSYYLETEPARIVRKGISYVPTYPYKPIKGKEPTLEFSFGNMITAGINAVKGKGEIDEYIAPFRVMDRITKTQAEIDETDKWLARHPNIRKARSIAELITEIAVGIAFEAALVGVVVGGIKQPRLFLKDFFSEVSDVGIKRGFRDAFQNRLDDILKRGPAIDLDTPIPKEFIGERFADALPDFPDTPDMLTMQAFTRRVGVELTPDTWLDIARAKPIHKKFELLRSTGEYLYDNLPDNIQKAWGDKDIFAGQFAIYTMDPADFIATKIPTVTSAMQSSMTLLGVAGMNTDDIARELVMQSYARRVIEGQLIPRNTANEMVEAVSYGKITKARDIANLNHIQIEQLVDNISTWMAAPADARKAVGAVSSTFKPQWAVFHKLGLFKQYAEVEDANFLVMRLLDQREDFLDGLRQLYKERLGVKWDIEESTMAWYAGQNRLAPVEVHDALSTKLGSSIREYDRSMEFIQRYVKEDKVRYIDVLRDEAVKQGRIGPGTDAPIIEHYVSWKLAEPEFGAHWAASRQRYSRTVPKNTWAPEFRPRRHGLTEAQLNTSYDPVMREVVRHSARKLEIEPALHRLDAVIKNTPAYKENPILELWYGDWKIHSVFTHPTKSDVKMNAALNRVSEGLERATHGKWQPSGRAFEQFSAKFRQGLARGVLAANLRPVAKNVFQSLLTFNLIGAKATTAGWGSMFSKGGREILNELLFTKGRGPFGKNIMFGAVDITNPKLWDRFVTYGGIAAVDKYWNTAGAVNGYLWKSINKSTRKKNILYAIGHEMGFSKGMVDGSKFWDTTAVAIRQGYFKTDIHAARQVLYFSQWNYNRLGAPPYTQSAFGRLAGQFSTWPAHYLTVHLTQLGRQTPLRKLLKRTPETIFGMKPTAWEQTALFRHAATAATIAYIGKEMGYRTDFLIEGAKPTGRVLGQEVPLFVAPGAELAINFGAFLVGLFKEDGKMEAKGFKGLARNIKTITPAGVAIQRSLAFQRGEISLGEVMFPAITEEKEKARKRIPMLPGLKLIPKLP